MASVAPSGPLANLRGPLRGGPLAATVLVVWLAGAFYCSGYERLLTGIDNWPGSLIWSAAAVLPWLALFEWSKSRAGRRVAAQPGGLAAMLVGTAAVSLALEAASVLLLGGEQTPLALALMRRLPAIGTSFILILWARTAAAPQAEADPRLGEIAATIDWVEAADNYVELHIGQRVAMRRMTMHEAERALAGRGFVRIHRRFLVNRARIRSVKGNGEKIVRLEGGAELPVGRRFGGNLDRPA